MTCKSSIGCSPQPQGCPQENGCIPGVCPDFVIRRHDTKPDFKVLIEDCDGPMDLTDLVLEASMWAKGKLKKAITTTDTYFALADNIGFNQIMIGDIIIMDRPRLVEKMLVTAFDEDDRLVQVQRGYGGTTVQDWKKGTPLKIMKFLNSSAQTEMLREDVLNIDGTTTPNVLIDSFFIYEWGQNDTCLPGCYYLEFKLMKMITVESQSIDETKAFSYPAGPAFGPFGPFEPAGETGYDPGNYGVPGSDKFPVPPTGNFIDEVNMLCIPDMTPSVIPSFIDAVNYGCGLAAGVEWVRRFPVDSEGFLIQVTDSITAEN